MIFSFFSERIAPKDWTLRLYTDSTAFDLRLFSENTQKFRHLRTSGITRIWNQLPNEIRLSTTLRTFNPKLKDYYYSVVQSTYKPGYSRSGKTVRIK